MTTYSTGNPVGSPDPRDLYDNAENLDNAANSDDATWTDRLGQSRRTMAGIEQDAITAIQNAGYVGTGTDNAIEDYAAGIEITQYNQIVRDGGEFWRVSGSETLPYTLTGAGVPEGGALVSVGDAALRQELADGTADVTSRTGSQTLAEALDDRAGLLTSDLTVLIPTDYPTLQDAIDDLSNLRTTQGVTIDLMIESGHEPASGIYVTDGDYSHFRISSVDAEVVLSASFTSGGDFLSGRYASLPILNALIDANYRCRYGFYCHESSRGYITSGSGVRRAGEVGLHARHGSCVNAGGSVWTDTGTGVNASAILSWSAVVNATGATWSNSAYYGAQAAAGGILNVRSGIGLNCAEYSVRATNSGVVNARGVDSSGSGIGFRSFDGGVINALLSTADNCNVGYFCQHGSILNANNTSAQNCSSAGYQTLNGHIDATSGDASGSAVGFSALRGGTINAFESTATGCTTSAVAVENGGQVNADGPCNFSGCTGARTLEVVTGGKLTARAADLTNSSGVALFIGQAEATVSGADFTGTIGNWVEINSGSFARVFGSSLTTENTNVSEFNSINGTNGIIWA